MWPNPQFPADLITFTEEIMNGTLFFCVVHISVSFIPCPLPWVEGILLGSKWKSTEQ